MTYTVSLSRIFKEQLAQIKEFDCVINFKRVIQNMKDVAKQLERMDKSGISVETTRIKSKVENTKYSIVYRVVNNPRQKLIARKIIRHK